jgi:hypothetical protein
MRVTILTTAVFAAFLAAAHAQIQPEPPDDPCARSRFPNLDQGATFTNPKPSLHNLWIDHCFHLGQGCGQQAADWICRNLGRIKGELATSCPWRYHKHIWVVGDEKPCNGHCGAFDYIVCWKLNR